MKLLGVTVVLSVYVAATFSFIRLWRTRRTPYCPLSRRVKIITQQRRFGREILSKRGMSWPYNCLYASILQYKGSFNYLPLIEKCCKSCSFPAFTTCIQKHGSSWRCPSLGLHCVVKCVNAHDPNRKPPIVVPPRRRMWGRRTTRVRYRIIRRKPTTNPKCERTVRKGGKYCIERLCIPIKLT